jgi:hypothetical protein
MGNLHLLFSDRSQRSAGRQRQKIPVPQRAQEIAEQIKAEIGSVPGISHTEAVKGYLNLYFTTSEYARRVVDEVLASRADFGRGKPQRPSGSWWNTPSQIRTIRSTSGTRAHNAPGRVAGAHYGVRRLRDHPRHLSG